MPFSSQEFDALTRNAGARWLSDQAVIAVSGDDAKTWLNGQLTNDLKNVGEDEAVYGLFLNTRGKVLSDAWVIANGAELWAVVPRGKVGELVAHLEKYVIMEDVLLEAREVVVMGVEGPRAGEIAAEVGKNFVCDRLGIGGRDWIVMKEDAAKLETVVGAALSRVGGMRVEEDAWEAVRVSRGRAAFGVDFWDAHYPQEAGLEGRAVSFSKGCYLGQEVVCTLENRGQINRRLVRMTIADEKELSGVARGTTIAAGDGAGVGEVTSIAAGPSGWNALGYVKRRHAVPGGLVQVGEFQAKIVDFA